MHQMDTEALSIIADSRNCVDISRTVTDVCIPSPSKRQDKSAMNVKSAVLCHCVHTNGGWLPDLRDLAPLEISNCAGQTHESVYGFWQHVTSGKSTEGLPIPWIN
jgi:hypothetical protein